LDARVTYVIWNREIFNRDRATEGWRPYDGPNPHNHHMHVSIKASARNDVSKWPWSCVIGSSRQTEGSGQRRSRH